MAGYSGGLRGGKFTQYDGGVRVRSPVDLLYNCAWCRGIHHALYGLEVCARLSDKFAEYNGVRVRPTAITATTNNNNTNTTNTTCCCSSSSCCSSASIMTMACAYARLSLRGRVVGRG